MHAVPTPRLRPGWVDDNQFPFASRFIDLNGNVVHYVDEGAGPTILFLHGNPTWSFVYRDAIAALSDRFRCIALDYPGFGLSRAGPGYGLMPDEHAGVVVAFLDALGLTDVTLAVQDWGGPIGMRAAEARPARIARFVIGNSWAWPVNGDRHFERFSSVMGGAPGRALIERFNLFVNVMIPKGHRRRKVPKEEMAQYRAALPTRSRRRATAILPRQIIHGQSFLAEVAAGLPALADRPALIVWGDADIAFRDRELRRWEATFPDHRTTVVPGAGHYIQSDAAGDYVAAIRGWIGAEGDAPAPAAADTQD